VKHQDRTWRPAWRVAALALVLAAIPLPGLAGEPAKPVPPPGLRASMDKSAASLSVALADAKSAPPPGLRASVDKAAASRSGALAQVKPATDKSELGSTSFFKKPVGIVVLALVGAGAGYMAYSLSNDRIHSTVRQNQ